VGLNPMVILSPSLLHVLTPGAIKLLTIPPWLLCLQDQPYLSTALEDPLSIAVPDQLLPGYYGIGTSPSPTL